MWQYWHNGLAMLVMFVVVSPALSQEDLPKPNRDQAAEAKPESEPKRETRRERLLGIGLELLDQFIKPAAEGEQAERAEPKDETPLDVPGINERFEELAAPLVADDPAVEKFDLRLDPQGTNLAKDRARLLGTLGLRRSAWSSQPSTMNFGLTLGVSPAPPAAHIGGQLTMHTDVVAMANYGLARRKEQPVPEVSSSLPTAEELFAARFHERLKYVPAISSMDDLADLFVSATSLRMGAYNDAIEYLKVELEAEAREDQRRSLARRLFETRKQRDRLFETRVKIVRDDHDYARAITVSLPGTNVGRRSTERTVAVSVTERQVDVSLDLVINKGVPLYYVFKPVMMKSLRGIQSGDAGALKHAGGLLRQGFSRGRKEIIGEEPKRDEQQERE